MSDYTSTIQDNEYDFKLILEELDKNDALANLEKVFALYLSNQNVDYGTLMGQIQALLGNLGAQIMTYIIQPENIEQIPDKKFKHVLVRLNNIKNLYGSLLRELQLSVTFPFLLKSFIMSGEENRPVINLILKRNDGEKFALQLDFNALMNFSIQTFDRLNAFILNEDFKINFEENQITPLLSTIAKFVETVQRKTIRKEE
ncbi:hypothetical protein O9H85_28840 [Paenibacillus filicis]|uniref:Uncharacterized protein n=1 Tax=Paenibacillus gyeongsangnamensis TaxID=3388067 RepID=A0ABT4QHN4_9BACL|nr:hypothetical protein [Paenibacillus filicis]MCZ8516328.1 hypothetical protein [Paenibacillus filicis]